MARRKQKQKTNERENAKAGAKAEANTVAKAGAKAEADVSFTQMKRYQSICRAKVKETEANPQARAMGAEQTPEAKTAKP